MIAILTDAQDIRRAVEAGEGDGSGEAGEDGAGAPPTAGVATLLLNEMLPSIRV